MPKTTERFYNPEDFDKMQNLIENTEEVFVWKNGADGLDYEIEIVKNYYFYEWLETSIYDENLEIELWFNDERSQVFVTVHGDGNKNVV